MSKAVRQTVKTFKRLRKAKAKMDKRQGKKKEKTVPEAAEIPKQRVLHHKDQII